MANAFTSYGLTGGPDIHICNPDGVQDKKLSLDDNGNILLDGKRIGDTGALIQAQTTSGVSATDYTTGLTSDYNRLVLDLDDWEPATDGAFPEILFSTDGGSTWAEAAGSYGWVATGARIGNHEKQGSDSDTKIQLTPTGVSNVAGEGMSGTVVFHGAKSATSRCTMEWVLGYHDTGTRVLSITGYAKRLADENIDAIRIQASDGNHSVVSALWGIKDA